MIRIHKPGSIVSLGMQSVLVTECNIASEGVTYRVVWWDGTSRYSQWVSALEVTEAPEATVGFHRATNQPVNATPQDLDEKTKRRLKELQRQRDEHVEKG